MQTEKAFRKKQIYRVLKSESVLRKSMGGSWGIRRVGKLLRKARFGGQGRGSSRRTIEVWPREKMNVLGFPRDDRNLEGNFVKMGGQRAEGTKPLWVLMSHQCGRGALDCSGSLLMSFHNPSCFMGSDLPCRITGIWGLFVSFAEQLHPLHDTCCLLCLRSLQSPKFRIVSGAVLGREPELSPWKVPSLLRTFWSDRFDLKFWNVKGKT